MAECCNGHPNPTGWEFCGVCGAPIDAAAAELERRFWDGTRWAIAGIGIVVVIAILCGGVILAVVTNDRRSANSTTNAENAMDEWVAGAGAHVTELQSVLEDAQRAIRSYDPRGLQTACENMHGVAEVDLAAHLPTPDPDLTSELSAATEDAHAAAHMCLTELTGPGDYTGEFGTYIDEAIRNVAAAQQRIKRALHRSQ